MKKLFLVLTISTFLFAGQVVELAGDKSYPPYSYSENGVAKGAYVDILKSAFSKIDSYDIKFKMMAYKKAINMIKKGKVIGFFPPYYSDERTTWTKFSEPILEEKTIVFAREEILKNIKSFPKDFYGMTVCLNRGFGQEVMGGVEFVKAIKSKKITLIEANKNKDCLNRIKRKIADFYINDQLIDISDFKMIKKGIAVKSNSGHIGFTLKTKKYPFINDLQIKIDKVIKEMKRSGEIDKMIKKYK
jgi:polar amino acid transport system substrate-binding protein